MYLCTTKCPIIHYALILHYKKIKQQPRLALGFFFYDKPSLKLGSYLTQKPRIVRITIT